MKFISDSITSKLLLLFLGVGLISVLIVGSYSFYSAKRAIMSRTIDQLISVRTIKKQQLEYLFDVKKKNLKNLFLNENFRKYLVQDSINPGNKQEIRDLCDAYGFMDLYLEKNGKLSFLTEKTGEKTIPSSVKLNILKITRELSDSSQITISDMFYNFQDDTMPVILIAFHPGFHRETGIPAVIASISSAEINSIMLQDNSRTGLGNSGEAYIVGEDFYMRSESRFKKNSILKVPVASETARKAMNGDTGASLSTDYRRIHVFSAYEPLRITGLHWVLLAEIDYEEAMVPVTSLRNDILLVSVIISLLIMGFSQVITRMITQPIIRLKNAAAGLGRGEFDKKVIIRTTDEIGMLAQAFNQMSDQLQEERVNRLKALYDGQEMERKRISRELHDGLGQKLVGTKLQIENCNNEDLDCLRKTMNDAKSQLHSAVEELRRISNDLTPASLSELGLEIALQNLCGRISYQTGTETEFEYNLNFTPDDKTSVYLFRICQEALNNIIRHSGAKKATVQLLESRELLILMIEDNGSGFDTIAISGGNGLINMRERAALLGGSFSVESSSGSGTTIRVKIPVNQ